MSELGWTTIRFLVICHCSSLYVSIINVPLKCLLFHFDLIKNTQMLLHYLICECTILWLWYIWNSWRSNYGPMQRRCDKPNDRTMHCLFYKDLLCSFATAQSIAHKHPHNCKFQTIGLQLFGTNKSKRDNTIRKAWRSCQWHFDPIDYFQQIAICYF